MKNPATIILLFFSAFLIGFTALLYPFSKKPDWIPTKTEYEIELINNGDLPLEIYSLEMAIGKYAEIENKSFVIDSAETVSVYLYASSCIDTLIIKCNDPEKKVAKILLKYNVLKVRK